MKPMQPTVYPMQDSYPLGPEITVLAGPAGTMQAKRLMFSSGGRSPKKPWHRRCRIHPKAWAACDTERAVGMNIHSAFANVFL